MNKNYTLKEINTIAKEIINLSKNKTLLFYGEIGVGKTTLIKEICSILGVRELTKSPSFSLVNTYLTSNNKTIYHFDFYRIKNEEEAYDIGVEDYLYSDSWCLIEWPEKIKHFLPLNTTKIYISLLKDDIRNIKLKINQ